MSRLADQRRAQTGHARLDEFTITATYAVGGTIDVTNLPDLIRTWLRVTGPTSTLIWYELARRSVGPDPDPVIVAELGTWCGCAPGVVWKSIDRLVTFDRLTWLSGDCLAVEACTLPPRPRRVSA